MNEQLMKMKKRERIQDAVLMVVAMAPGAVVFAGFAWGFLMWALGVKP